jgi:glycosyltransferase involved in cell wall biosynthesis
MSALSISVVIATYNRGALIGRTLDSIARQTRPVSEIIVSDDASTDDTVAWIGAHYPAVRVVTFPNGGTSAARNRGAAVATGDVLVFLDHDDELMPHAIHTLEDLLVRFPSVAAAFADHAYREDATQTYHENHHSLPFFHRLRDVPALRVEGSDRVYGRPLHQALLRGNLLQQPWAIRRDIFQQLGGFDERIRYCEDWEMYLRVTEGRAVALSDTAISIHYVTASPRSSPGHSIGWWRFAPCFGTRSGAAGAGARAGRSVTSSAERLHEDDFGRSCV